MSSIVVAKVQAENFEAFKRAYDAGEGLRREHGVRGVTVARDASSPHLVTIVTRFDSVDAAKKMFASETWKAQAKQAGAPMVEAFFLDVVDEKSY